MTPRLVRGSGSTTGGRFGTYFPVEEPRPLELGEHDIRRIRANVAPLARALEELDQLVHEDSENPPRA